MSDLFSPGSVGSPTADATSDRAFLEALLAAESALVRARAVVGLTPADAAAAVTEVAADVGRFDVQDIASRAREGGNPVIPLVSALRSAVPAEAAAHVHRGATSQDILDSALMLLSARTLDLILTDLARTERALARLASAHRDTVMPGRTLTQHAVPTTFGLKAAGWRSLVLDARDRLIDVRAGLPVQLGGAAGTLASFRTEGGCGRAGEALTSAFAGELALCAPALPWHTLRTPVADLASALALTAGAHGKMAADVLTLSRTEIAELSEREGGGSSSMPHKANPVRATLIAAAARRAPGLAATLHASLVAEDERPAGAWHAEWEPLRDLLRLTGGAARDGAELVEGLRVHTEAMRENLALTGGLPASERATTVLTSVLGSAAAAKELLTGSARRARAEGRPLAAVLAEEPALRDFDVTALMDPAQYTGYAGELTDRALERR
ncbi:3-carboxy-cis,cis-muconate cycloisomerase [Streptomyces sp. Je 1-369]|uniref:3-carboxy-cis,cis-muconate cycloisomerase n=1 Tax=Streptomyces sp. Je 1-369 TaxID=2966192 RepID=UPI0022859EA6|nr:3-carboxy-cis,cis-muconate cycloisomerase [Streptomyces sp. Je 1-369]WAL99086.1 3-carboxy-cis,cis-muconate cycloisomerase [Streptomyces sp. Je 1-369]